MRKILVIGIVVSLLSSSNCVNKSNPILTDNSAYLRFERMGGGQKQFDVYRTAISNTFLCRVSKLAYRDTSIEFKVTVDYDNIKIFQPLMKTLNFQIPIKGDFTKTTALTGTWTYFYVIRGEEITEITNSSLRSQLSGLELIVNQYLQ